MYSTFPKDLMKILFFATLVSIIFTLTGWQAGSLYFNLHTEKRKAPAPLYIFPVPKAVPLPPSPIASNDKKIQKQKSIEPKKKIFPESISKTTAPLVLKSKPTPVLKKKKTYMVSKKKKTISEKKKLAQTVSRQEVKKPDAKTVLLTYPENKIEHHAMVYSIQTGIFRFRTHAEENFNYCSQQGYNPVMVILDYKQKSKIYSVRCGQYKNKKTARIACKNFKLKEKKDAYLTTLYSKKHLVAVAKKFSN